MQTDLTIEPDGLRAAGGQRLRCSPAMPRLRGQTAPARRNGLGTALRHRGSCARALRGSQPAARPALRSAWAPAIKPSARDGIGWRCGGFDDGSPLAHRPTPNTASIRWRSAGRACAAAVIASAGAGRWTLYKVVAASDRVCVQALPARAASRTGFVRIELSLARRALPDRGSSVMHSGSGFGVLTGWHCMSWPCRLLVHDRCGG